MLSPTASEKLLGPGHGPGVWPLRERLALASAILDVDNHQTNWPAISKKLTRFTTSDRPTDWCSSRVCAKQYALLLDSVELTRRQKNPADVQGSRHSLLNSTATSSTPVLSTTERLVKRLTAERVDELRERVQLGQKYYEFLKTKLLELEQGLHDNHLFQLCRQMGLELPTCLSAESYKPTLSALPIDKKEDLVLHDFVKNWSELLNTFSAAPESTWSLPSSGLISAPKLPRSSSTTIATTAAPGSGRLNTLLSEAEATFRSKNSSNTPFALNSRRGKNDVQQPTKGTSSKRAAVATRQRYLQNSARLKQKQQHHGIRRKVVSIKGYRSDDDEQVGTAVCESSDSDNELLGRNESISSQATSRASTPSTTAMYSSDTDELLGSDHVHSSPAHSENLHTSAADDVLNVMEPYTPTISTEQNSNASSNCSQSTEAASHSEESDKNTVSVDYPATNSRPVDGVPHAFPGQTSPGELLTENVTVRSPSQLVENRVDLQMEPDAFEVHQIESIESPSLCSVPTCMYEIVEDHLIDPSAVELHNIISMTPPFSRALKTQTILTNTCSPHLNVGNALTSQFDINTLVNRSPSQNSALTDDIIGVNLAQTISPLSTSPVIFHSSVDSPLVPKFSSSANAGYENLPEVAVELSPCPDASLFYRTQDIQVELSPLDSNYTQKRSHRISKKRRSSHCKQITSSPPMTAYSPVVSLSTLGSDELERLAFLAGPVPTIALEPIVTPLSPSTYVESPKANDNAAAGSDMSAPSPNRPHHSLRLRFSRKGSHLTVTSPLDANLPSKSVSRAVEKQRANSGGSYWSYWAEDILSAAEQYLHAFEHQSSVMSRRQPYEPLLRCQIHSLRSRVQSFEFTSRSQFVHALMSTFARISMQHTSNTPCHEAVHYVYRQIGPRLKAPYLD